jgi:hypothetical protein
MAPLLADGPRGIGGWLILPLLGLVFTPVRIGADLVRDILPAFQPEHWNALTTVGEESYHPLWAPILVFELVSNVLFIGFTVVLLVLFLRRSHRVPGLMIAWQLGGLTMQLVDLALGASIPAVASTPGGLGIGDVSRSVVGAAIWIPYFLRSVRVRNTFTE